MWRRAVGLMLVLGALGVFVLPRLQASGKAQTVDCGQQPYAEFQVAGQPRLWLEVVRTSAERSVGLMYRSELAPDAGMLFVFDGLDNGGFWMRNTYVPLSIAFVEPDGTINTILDMQPLTEEIHYANQPYKFAIEANQGWFAQNGVQVGARVTLCFV